MLPVLATLLAAMAFVRDAAAPAPAFRRGRRLEQHESWRHAHWRYAIFWLVVAGVGVRLVREDASALEVVLFAVFVAIFAGFGILLRSQQHAERRAFGE